MTNVTYSRKDIEAIVDMVSANPQGFLSLTKKYCPPERLHQVRRSMKAWNIRVPEADGNHTSNRTTRRR